MKTHFFRTQRLSCGTFFSIHREVFTLVFLLVVLVLVLGGPASASPRHNLKRDSAGQAGRSQFFYSLGQGYFNYPSSDDNWLGGTGNWTNAALWSAGVPGSSSDVFIGSGGDDRSIYTPSNGTINSLTVGAATGTAEFQEMTGAGLVVSGTLNNQVNGTVINAGTLSVASLANLGTLNNQGTLTLTNQPNGITQIAPDSQFDNIGTVLAGSNNAFAQLQDIEGHFLQHNGQTTNITPGSGTLTIGAPGFFEMSRWNTMTSVQVNGDLNNQGRIRTDGGALTVTGAFNNAGSLLWYGDGFANVNRLTATHGLVNTGSIGLAFGSVLSTPYFSNSNYLSIDHASAFLVGTGTAGAGYQQFADGRLTENLGDAFHFGVMFADSFALDGTLDIELQNGFTPQAGSSFIIGYAKAGGLSGQFANISNQFFNNGTEEWVVNYDNPHGYLELDAIDTNAPEPGTLLLLGTSMAGVGGLLRRRIG
jgi:PEP-CTERM motif